MAHVSGTEKARKAGFKVEWLRAIRAVAGFRQVTPGQDKSILVPFYGGRQPVRLRLGADHDVHGIDAALHFVGGHAIACPDRVQASAA